MNALIQSVLASKEFDHRQVSEFTAAEIRDTIAALVATEEVALADALCEAGLSIYPGDENILAMAALMSSLQGDYPRSEEYVRELIEVQGGQATEFTWNLLVRVLRCQAEPIEALSVAKAGLLQHPTSIDLKREKQELEALFGDAAIFVNPVAVRQ